MVFVDSLREYERQRLEAGSTRVHTLLQRAIMGHRSYIIGVYNDFVQRNLAFVSRSVNMSQMGVPLEVQAVIVEALNDTNLDPNDLSAIAMKIARRRR